MKRSLTITIESKHDKSENRLFSKEIKEMLNKHINQIALSHTAFEMNPLGKVGEYETDHAVLKWEAK